MTTSLDRGALEKERLDTQGLDIERPRRTSASPPAPIPFTRLLRVELTKMFDTRAGLWLMTSIAATALIATVAVIAFAPDASLTYNSFGAAVGVPIAILLPIVAILSVTSEYTQRSGLTTFTLVPDRGRVIRSKLAVSVLIGVLGIGVALGIGAIGNLIGRGIAGVDVVWDVGGAQLAGLFQANVLNMLIGFMLGVLIRNSPGAIVGYFVYSLVLPTLSMALGAFQDWWHDLAPWLDFNFAQAPCTSGSWAAATGRTWAPPAPSGWWCRSSSAWCWCCGPRSSSQDPLRCLGMRCLGMRFWDGESGMRSPAAEVVTPHPVPCQSAPGAPPWPPHGERGWVGC